MQQSMVKKILDEGTPEPIPCDAFNFLKMHASSKEEV